MDRAEKIVNNIMDELEGRKGFNHWYWDIEPDIKDELIQKLISIVRDELS